MRLDSETFPAKQGVKKAYSASLCNDQVCYNLQLCPNAAYNVVKLLNIVVQSPECGEVQR